MEKSLKLYKKFIDDIVGLRPSISATWVLSKKKWPETKHSPENKEINRFIDSLDDSQREQLANLLNDAYDSGIHDTLVYINDRMAIDGLIMNENGIEMAQQPFDTTMYYDWVCRCEGDSWPDEE